MNENPTHATRMRYQHTQVMRGLILQIFPTLTRKESQRIVKVMLDRLSVADVKDIGDELNKIKDGE